MRAGKATCNDNNNYNDNHNDNYNDNYNDNHNGKDNDRNNGKDNDNVKNEGNHKDNGLKFLRGLRPGVNGDNTGCFSCMQLSL